MSAIDQNSRSLTRKSFSSQESKSKFDDDIESRQSDRSNAEEMLDAKAGRKRAEGDLQLLANR
jgi:hypothetical protein